MMGAGRCNLSVSVGQYIRLLSKQSGRAKERSDVERESYQDIALNFLPAPKRHNATFSIVADETVAGDDIDTKLLEPLHCSGL